MKTLLAHLIWIVYSVWVRTWRLKIVESNSFKCAVSNQDPRVYAFWHGEELGIINLARFYDVATMVSTSKDGDLLNRVLVKLRVKTSRGSSTRGGVGALKGLIDLSTLGYTPVVAVDGPKGPIHQVKPGVFQIAQSINASVFPVSFEASHYIEFKKSWNRARLPLPFAMVVVVWGDAFKVDKNLDPRDQSLATELKHKITAAHQDACNLIA